MRTLDTLPAVPQPRCSDEDIPVSILVGGWTATRNYVNADLQGDRVATQQGMNQPTPHPVRDAIAKRRETRRLNRAFRRDQRDFNRVMDTSQYDPAGQRELQTIWTCGR